MGKRSDFPRRPHDDYDTPLPPVRYVVPFLRAAGIERFAEPCAGHGHLIAHLESYGFRCVFACELRDGLDVPPIVEQGVDVLACGRQAFRDAQVLISNPPWTRQLQHPIIWHCCNLMPSWFLYDSDWAHNRQAAPLLRHCSHIVSAGRVKWMPGTKHAAKDNAAWHRFDRQHTAGPVFVGRETEAA